MDFRLNDAIRQWQEERGLTAIDTISIAGVTKDYIVDNNGSEEFITRNIKVSTELHQADTLIIMHHMDCGAYGGHASFESLEAERAFQLDQMAQAKAKLEANFPGLIVERWLADIRDDGTVVIEPAD